MGRKRRKRREWGKSKRVKRGGGAKSVFECKVQDKCLTEGDVA
jgi:hypothetical protein